MSVNYWFLVTFSQFVSFKNEVDLLYKLTFAIAKNEVYNMFGKLFGNNKTPKEEKVLPWQNLTSIEQLDDIELSSKGKTQLIFKHSTRCGISTMVLNQFTEAYDLDLNADLYYLDLLNYRDVSNEVGYKFQVIHQSPQLLIIKNGVVVAHASHGAINDLDLSTFI